MKNSGLPLKPKRYAFENAPRCTATSKRTGERCKGPAMRGWNVCRFHWARGGAPRGTAHGNYKHGRYSQEQKAEAKRIRDLLKEVRAALAKANERSD